MVATPDDMISYVHANNNVRNKSTRNFFLYCLDLYSFMLCYMIQIHTSEEVRSGFSFANMTEGNRLYVA